MIAQDAVGGSLGVMASSSQQGEAPGASGGLALGSWSIAAEREGGDEHRCQWAGGRAAESVRFSLPQFSRGTRKQEPQRRVRTRKEAWGCEE